MMYPDTNLDDDENDTRDFGPYAQGFQDGIQGLSRCPSDHYTPMMELEYIMAHQRGARILADRKAAQ